MFPRQHRLTGKGAHFVARRGQTVHGTFLRLKWTPAKGSFSRVTVVAGLVVDKRAVTRNRLKRQIREIVRPLLSSFSYPINGMVFINKSAGGVVFVKLKAELTSLFKRARIL